MKTRIFYAVAVLLLYSLNNAGAQTNRSLSSPTGINQNLLPGSSNAKDLGSSQLAWKDVY